MTIDPENFEAQGKPTPEQAKEVWLQLSSISKREVGCRPVAAELERRGFSIKWRTIARWKLKDPEWNDAPPGTAALASNRMVRGVKKEIAAELLNIPEGTRVAADTMSIVGIPAAVLGTQGQVQDEVTVIDQRIKQLVLLSEAELDLVEQKSRKILNIVLTEAAARRANVMVLIPRDTGAFVEAMSEASKQTLTGGIEQMPKSGDPRVIDGEITDVTPPTPLQDAIRKFKREKELT